MKDGQVEDKLLAAAVEALATLEHHQADIWPFAGDMSVVKMLREAIQEKESEEPKPNRVVIEVEGNHHATVRAERPKDVAVILYDVNINRAYDATHRIKELGIMEKELGL
jgi:hypothetical protein